MLLLYRLERYRAAQRLSVVRSTHFRRGETGSISSDAGCAVCRNGFFKLLRIDNAIWRQSLQSAMTRSLESVLDRHIRPSVRLSVCLSLCLPAYMSVCMTLCSRHRVAYKSELSHSSSFVSICYCTVLSRLDNPIVRNQSINQQQVVLEDLYYVGLRFFVKVK